MELALAFDLEELTELPRDGIRAHMRTYVNAVSIMGQQHVCSPSIACASMLIRATILPCRCHAWVGEATTYRTARILERWEVDKHTHLRLGIKGGLVAPRTSGVLPQVASPTCSQRPPPSCFLPPRPPWRLCPRVQSPAEATSTVSQLSPLPSTLVSRTRALETSLVSRLR